VVGERRAGPIAGQLPVKGQERVSIPPRAQPLEVNGEEGDISENVAIPETVVELDAVEDPRPVIRQKTSSA
jgi:hypothetical protein